MGYTSSILRHIDRNIDTSPRNTCLGGALGAAILANRYFHTFDKSGIGIRRAERYLEILLANLKGKHPMRFFGGLPGVAWLLAHMAYLDNETPDLSEFLFYLDLADLSDYSEGYDLISGVSGMAVLGMELAHHENENGLLSRAVEILAAQVYRKDDLCAWYTPQRLVDPKVQSQFPAGCIDLGVAHGIGGPVLVLAGAVRLGVMPKIAHGVLADVIPWYFDQLVDGPEGLYMPARANQRESSHSRRLAWCYNQLGAMVATAIAGVSCSEPSWTSKAVEILRDSLGTTEDQAEIRDCCLCHGISGVALLYQVLYWYTSIPEFLNESRRWYRLLLQGGSTSGDGKGFLKFARLNPNDGTTYYESDNSLLSGSGGVALGMLASISPIVPSWIRILGLY